MVDLAKAREHMTVIGSCGTAIGRVDRIEGLSIKLTRDTKGARGEHRYIPTEWVDHIDDAVHLKKNAQDVQEQWQAHPGQEGEYPPEIGS